MSMKNYFKSSNCQWKGNGCKSSNHLDKGFLWTEAKKSLGSFVPLKRVEFYWVDRGQTIPIFCFVFRYRRLMGALVDAGFALCSTRKATVLVRKFFLARKAPWERLKKRHYSVLERGLWTMHYWFQR